MQLDINNVLDVINEEWANDLANANKKIAMLVEENRLLKEKLKEKEGDVNDTKRI